MKSIFKLLSPINNSLLAALYAVFYDYVYRSYILVVWGHFYTDRPYHTMEPFAFFCYILLSITPFLLYKGVKTIAAAFSLFLFLFVYIPFLDALLIYEFPSSIRIEYLLVFFFLMCLFFATDRKYLCKSLFANRKKRLPVKLLEYITLLLFAILVLLNKNLLKFVNFFADAEDLYLFREDMDSVSAVYILCWLRAAFLPLLMVYYLNNKIMKKYIVCIIAYIFLFMLDKQKLTILFPIAITTIFYISKRYNLHFGRYFHLVLILLFIVFPILVISFESNPIVSVIAMTLVMRLQCIAGLQMEHYLSFFVLENNPFTLYGHINIINWLTGVYPYTESIGKTINTDGSDSNATFLLMDGIAALGVIGCLIIGFAFVILKSIINSCDRKCEISLCVPIFLFSIQSMLNVSLFTTFFTHGILLILIMFYFFDLKGLSHIKN